MCYEILFKERYLKSIGIYDRRRQDLKININDFSFVKVINFNIFFLILIFRLEVYVFFVIDVKIIYLGNESFYIF